MSGSPDTDPFAILEDFAARVTSSPAGSSASDDSGESWMGIGVRAAGQQLAVPLADVRELIGVPHWTRVPGTRAWLLGLASVGGRLVSVVDLGAFLKLDHRTEEPGRQVVLLRNDAAPMALLVDQVVGLKRFSRPALESDVTDAPDWLSPYLAGIWRDGGEAWGMLDVEALRASPQFLQVAR